MTVHTVSSANQRRAIKAVRRILEQDPHDPDAQILAKLVLALESGSAFELPRLYEMSLDNFQLALDVLKEWRLDRYYASKVKLFDISSQVQELQRPVR